MGNQKILDVLNTLSVIEEQGGEDAYMLIQNSNENQKFLNFDSGEKARQELEGEE